jgi:hypothetical protein
VAAITAKVRIFITAEIFFFRFSTLDSPVSLSDSAIASADFRRATRRIPITINETAPTIDITIKFSVKGEMDSPNIIPSYFLPARNRVKNTLSHPSRFFDAIVAAG